MDILFASPFRPINDAVYELTKCDMPHRARWMDGSTFSSGDGYIRCVALHLLWPLCGGKGNSALRGLFLILGGSVCVAAGAGGWGGGGPRTETSVLWWQEEFLGAPGDWWLQLGSSLKLCWAHINHYTGWRWMGTQSYNTHPFMHTHLKSLRGSISILQRGLHSRMSHTDVLSIVLRTHAEKTKQDINIHHLVPRLEISTCLTFIPFLPPGWGAHIESKVDANNLLNDL